MWRHSFKTTSIICALVGVGIWLLSFNWGHVRTAQMLEQNSAEIDGRVVNSSSHELSKGGQSFTLVVEYAPEARPSITKEFAVNGDAYRAALATGKARVTYLPDDPQVSLVTKFAILPYQIGIGLGGLSLLSGLFCLGRVMKKAS